MEQLGVGILNCEADRRSGVMEECSQLERRSDAWDGGGRGALERGLTRQLHFRALGTAWRSVGVGSATGVRTLPKILPCAVTVFWLPVLSKGIQSSACSCQLSLTVCEVLLGHLRLILGDLGGKDSLGFLGSLVTGSIYGSKCVEPGSNLNEGAARVGSQRLLLVAGTRREVDLPGRGQSCLGGMVSLWEI